MIDPSLARPASGPVHWIGVLSAAIPCFVLSAVLVDVWRDPMGWDDGAWVRYGVGLLVLEFILLHSGVVIGTYMANAESPAKAWRAFAGLLVVYSMFAWGVALSTNSYGLLWVYGGIMAGRLVLVVTASREGANELMGRSAVATVYYILIVAATVFLPVPEWGITSSVLAEAYPGRGDGIWERHPERAIAGAALYFALLGLTELLVFGPKRLDWSDSSGS